MKNILSIIALLLALSATAQTVREDFAGFADVVSVSGAGPTYVITISNFNGNQRAFDDSWLISDMVAGDILWSGTCSRFIVLSRAGLAITVTDPDPGSAVLPNNTERISFVRETLINGYALAPIPQFGDGNAGAIAGATSASAGCIIAHYEKNTQDAINAGKEITYYAGTGTPAFTPSSGDPLLARNGVGDIYKYNGSAWVAVTPSLATTTTSGLFPAYNTLEVVTGATSVQAKSNATTATGLPFIWLDAGGAKSILIK